MRGTWLLASIGFSILAGTLPLTAADAPQPPVVYWASSPVQPGETVLATGSGLKDVQKIEVVRLPDGPAGEPPQETAPAWPGNGREVKAIQPDEISIKFTIPDDMEAGMYAFRVSNAVEAGASRTPRRWWSRTILLNRPTPLWLQGDQGETASPGGWIRILGYCLASKSDATTVQLEGMPPVKAKEANPYSLLVELPKDMKEGEYRVRVHTGVGGNAG